MSPFHRPLAALAASLAVGVAGAQPLSEVVVAAPRETSPSLTVPDAATAAARIDRVPGGASVVDLRTLQDRRLGALVDVLGETAGVFVQSRFGQDESRLSIRGSGLQRTFHLRGLRLLQDGVPLVQADGSGDFQAVEPAAARYVEVLRGANALRHGSTTLGGSVDVVSPTGYGLAGPGGRPGGAARLEAGSFGYRRAIGQLGLVGEASDGVLTVSSYREDGFREHSRTDARRLFANLGWRPSDALESRLFVAHVESDSELPGALTLAQLRADPRRANPTNLAQDQRRDIRLTRLANRTTLRAGGVELEAGAFVAVRDLFHPIFQLIDADGRDLGAFVRASLPARLGGLEQRWIAGIEPQVSRTDERRFVNVGGRAGAPTADGTQHASNLVAYAQAETEVATATTLVTGVQATRATRRFDDRLRAGGVDRGFDQDFERVSPKLGVVLRPSPGTTLFANASGAFEPPSFGELAGGPGIRPLAAQRARSFELGTRGRTGRASWDVVAYHAALRGELLSLNDAAGQPLGTVNAGRTVHRGIEAAGALEPVPWLELRAAWLVQDFRFDGDPVYGDARLPGLPPQFVRASAGWRPGAGVVVGPTLEASLRPTPIDMANSLSADRYAIWGLRASGPLGAGAAWWIDARNLSDRRHAAATGAIADAGGRDVAQFLPGPGRSLYAGLRLAF